MSHIGHYLFSKGAFLSICCLLSLSFMTRVYATTPIINIDIRNHLFIPSEITIPENTKVKLIIHNYDEEDEEFESYELNREKVIVGKRKGTIFIGPLPAGEYLFFGEFFPKTAQGKVIVE